MAPIELQRPDQQPAKIARMFDAIAERYDLLNRLLSGGIDRYWRWRAIRALGFTGRETVLDLCTGTGDVALAALRGGARRVLGIDFAHEMLRIGQRKVRGGSRPFDVGLVRGDAMVLPVAAASVDAVTMAFGIRNVFQPARAIAEVHRVLKPGGQLAILEFSMPRAPIVGSLYRWYFRHVLPRLGRLISRHHEAYTYLPQSVGAFFSPQEFSDLVTRAGFGSVRAVPLTFGIVYLYSARK